MTLKVKFFITIFLFLGVFLITGTALAYTEGEGHFVGHVYWFDDNMNYTSGNCSYWLYKGDYPSTAEEQSPNGTTISPCYEYANKYVDFDTRCNYTNCAEGNYWVKRDEYPGSTLEYYPITFSLGPSFTITSPATTSAITDPATDLDISYSGYTPGDTIRLYFANVGLGGQTAYSDSYTHVVVNATDTFSVPFVTFNLFSNENWYLIAKLNETTNIELSGYTIFYGYSPPDNSTFCGGYTSEATCPNTCVWQVGLNLCTGAPSTPNTDDYGFATEDFGYLGNMVRDVIVALFFPSKSNINYQFGSIKTTMEQKIPFAYFYALQTAFTTAQGELTTGAMPSITIDNPFNPEATITLLDLNDTKTLLGETEWNLIRTIIGYLLWIGGFLFIWETIHKGNTAKL